MTATAARHAKPLLSPEVEIDTPALIIDEEILHQNIQEMASLARSFGVAFRPHIKTHKMPEIARLEVAAGAVGIMCAKLGEAEVMAEGGIDDIAIGFAIVGQPKVRRLVALARRARIVAAVDSLAAARPLSEAMAAEEMTLDCYLEVDTGHHRSGVPAGEAAVPLALELARLPGLRLIGVMTHEGSANALGPESIEVEALRAGRALVETAELIRAAGVPIEVVSVGSTPAAAITPTVSGVTEMRPGTFVFKDTSAFRYGVYGPDRCAARIVTTVANRPAANRAILDAGAKTLSLDKSQGHLGHGYIVGHPEVIIDRLSEEHGVVVVPEGEPGFEVGNRVEIIPNHICTCVNLHNWALVVRNGEIVDRWRVAARGRVQ